MASVAGLELVLTGPKKAAKQNHIPTQTKIGMIYFESNDVDNAFTWFNQAAQQNDPHAQGFLGVFYEHGLGVRKNPKLALEWFHKAAKQGVPSAQYILGRTYKHKGTAQDISTAVSWYNKSAKQGNPDALTQLGLFYMRGHGVSRDAQQAVQFFHKASMKGQPLAQLSLGLMTITVAKTPEDELIAYTLLYAATSNNPAYFKKALDFDNRLVESLLAKAGSNISQLEKKFSSSEIKQARNKAKHYRIGNW